MKITFKKNVAGEIRSHTFTCAIAGKCDCTSGTPLQPQATIKCGCLAKLVVLLDSLVGYVIIKIFLEHNHNVKRENARYFHCNRYISSWVRNQVDLLDQSGVRLNKSYDVCVNGVGGHDNMTCSQKDCRNLIDKLRSSRLGEGDVVSILKYFSNMGSQIQDFIRMWM
ncbi:hypothetical protein MKX03_034624 [Papaver bracteatum]|nr:hypothetical protein MKX03_034624 [Papaver bracteatum]